MDENPLFVFVNLTAKFNSLLIPINCSVPDGSKVKVALVSDEALLESGSRIVPAPLFPMTSTEMPPATLLKLLPVNVYVLVFVSPPEAS